jgi:hypothetical protein
MGTLRIMATQSGPHTEEPTLRHIAEEARHAAFFRRHAEKAAERPLDYDDAQLLAPASGRLYFRRLDSVVTRAVTPRAAGGADGRLAYLWMSMTIEFRALWLYRAFDPIVRSSQPSFTLRTVLGEEEAHLEQMAARLDALGRFDAGLATRLCERETALFARLLASLERAAIPA